MHGTDAGVKAARAFHIAGVKATSNVFAARVYGIPASGTMAHSYIEAHEDELEAFRAFGQGCTRHRAARRHLRHHRRGEDGD
jgi:nicotinate phosphoribosyltransferase